MPIPWHAMTASLGADSNWARLPNFSIKPRASSMADWSLVPVRKNIAKISLSDKLSDLERKVVREVEEISNARGDKAMSILDQGFDGLFK